MKMALISVQFSRRRSKKNPLCSVLLFGVVLFPWTSAVPGRVGGDSDKHFSRRRRDLLVDPIVKNIETIGYPPENLWIKLQRRIPLSERFPCEERDNSIKWRSESRPESVHRLRPGDIDVIGAMGDSLSSGNGAREFTPMGVPIQDRGVTFSGGGISTWREFITLPNIFKVFNPKLVGHAVGMGEVGSYNAQLNVAIPAALDDDALKQVKLFVSKMLLDPRINFTSDWKVFSIFIGHNDICSYQCYNEKMHSPEAHKFQLQRAIDFLYTKVPRIFVNLISIMDTTITARMERTEFCKIVNRFACSCLFQKGDLNTSLSQMSRLVRKYQEAEMELAFSKRYRGRQDFTVEWQPFFQFTNKPIQPGEQENKLMLRSVNKNPLWTPDCFHYNQRGMLIWSTMLWNNMLEPVRSKSMTFQQFSHKDIKCPTHKAPFLFTKENSDNFYSLGNQQNIKTEYISFSKL